MALAHGNDRCLTAPRGAVAYALGSGGTGGICISIPRSTHASSPHAAERPFLHFGMGSVECSRSPSARAHGWTLRLEKDDIVGMVGEECSRRKAGAVKLFERERVPVGVGG